MPDHVERSGNTKSDVGNLHQNTVKSKKKNLRKVIRYLYSQSIKNVLF